MQIWPHSFPLPNTSLTGDGQPNTIRTTMESGAVRQRLRFTKENFSLSVTWELTDAEFAIFAAFHTLKLNLGTDWFLMDLPMGGGLQRYTVRFAEGRYKQANANVGYWNISATIEVQTRLIYDEATLDTFLQIGFSDEELRNLLDSIADFHYCIHTTLPSNLN